MTIPARIVETIDANRTNLRRVNPTSSGHSAIVYLPKQGPYVISTSRMTMGELWLSTPREVYEVDLSPHDETYEMQVPSLEEAFFFSAKVRVVWQVSNPIEAVRSRLVKPQHAIELYLEPRLREITRQFDVENSAAAERQINHQYSGREIPVSEAVVVKNCSVILILDTLASEHIIKRTTHQRDLEKIAMSKVEEEHTHQVEMQRAEYEQRLEEMKQRHELELKQQRMEAYADALRAGELNLIALRLADNSKDVNEVINMIMEQRKLEFDSAHAVLNSLLEGKLLNHKHVAAIMANASNVVIDNIRGTTKLGIGSADAARPAPLSVEASRPDEQIEEDDDPDD